MRYTTNFDKVEDFMRLFGQNVAEKPTMLDEKTLQLRLELIEEELRELYLGVERKNMIEIADALTDLLYVVYGMGAAMGIELDYCFDEVHRSNMSKLGEDGKPIYREDGKVMKGPNYKPPNMYDTVYHQEVLAKIKKIEENSSPNIDRDQLAQLSLFDDESAVTGKWLDKSVNFCYYKYSWSMPNRGYFLILIF